jgi:SAM-dependent MidA family methyltransferase
MQPTVPFEQFMHDALYGPHGFYTAGHGHAGRRRGDFLTSPEVGPLFGAVVARYLDAEWERLGRPDPFTFVDAGAGPGTLARSVLAAAPRCANALRYVAVDLSEPQRTQHPSGVESRPDLPAGRFDGVILANELLDNLPFRLAVYDGAWREAFVQPGRDGGPTEVLSAPFDPVPSVLPAQAKHGARAPLHDAARNWIIDARGHLTSGTVVAIDYAVARTTELAGRPWRDWLRTYRGHARGGHYLADPGSQDITTEVCIDQLPEPDAVRSQAQWLHLHGIADLVEQGKTYWAEHAARPDVAALQMRSRVAEAEALLDPAGLGGFTVAEWRAGGRPHAAR